MSTLHPILTECRVIKSEMEVALIQFANDISSEAHVEVSILQHFQLNILRVNDVSLFWKVSLWPLRFHVRLNLTIGSFYFVCLSTLLNLWIWSYFAGIDYVMHVGFLTGLCLETCMKLCSKRSRWRSLKGQNQPPFKKKETVILWLI